MSTEKLFPIGYAATVLGLTPQVIRAWEKRYGAVLPGRSRSNRRLYSAEDLNRLAMLKAAASRGQSISQAVALDPLTLERIAASAPPPMTVSVAASWSDGDERPIKRLSSEAMQAVKAMDTGSLMRMLAQASVGLTRIRFLDGFIAGLMQRIGAEWAAGTLGIAAEHHATTVVRGFLWQMLRRNPVPAQSPCMVLATPAGQSCELGVLMAALCAADCGWAPLFLGPDLPAEEIAAAAASRGAGAVAVGLSCGTDTNLVVDEMTRLRALVGSRIRIFVGGRAAGAYRTEIEGVDAVHVESLGAFAQRITLPAGVLPLYPQKKG